MISKYFLRDVATALESNSNHLYDKHICPMDGDSGML